MAYTKISKFLSLILRHAPDVINITLDRHGWADVSDLLQGMNWKMPVSMEILEEIVLTDEKQRYSFNSAHTKIRANQGHSLSVDVDLKIKQPPEYLFHGTAQKYEYSIDRNGLEAKSRLYVHLSSDKAAAAKVGRRHGTPVIVYRIRTGEMFREGFCFFQSENKIWLTRYVPVKYLEKIQEGIS